MNGGSIAKNAYRYQDWCAMYFALDEFKNGSFFERIYCEQEKLDFEIWNRSSFTGFQVKTTIGDLTAREVNKIFLFYLNKSLISGKNNKLFRFIFGQKPMNSLDHLFTVIRSGSRGVSYVGRVKKFIETALQNIPISSFSIDFHHFDQEQIKYMVFSISAEILKSRLGTTQDIQTEVVRNFVVKLRDEIDQISCKTQENERIYTPAGINILIDSFLASVKIERLENRGEISSEISLPQDAKRQTLEVRSPKLKPLGDALGTDADETKIVND